MCPAVLSCPLMQTSPADSYWTRDEVFGQVSLGPASRADGPRCHNRGPVTPASVPRGHCIVSHRPVTSDKAARTSRHFI